MLSINWEIRAFFVLIIAAKSICEREEQFILSRFHKFPIGISSHQGNRPKWLRWLNRPKNKYMLHRMVVVVVFFVFWINWTAIYRDGRWLWSIRQLIISLKFFYIDRICIELKFELHESIVEDSLQFFKFAFRIRKTRLDLFENIIYQFLWILCYCFRCLFFWFVESLHAVCVILTFFSNKYHKLVI